MTMTELEVVADYRQAKKPAKQIKVLAELNSCKPEDICRILLAHPESGFSATVQAVPRKRAYARKPTPEKTDAAPKPEAAPVHIPKNSADNTDDIIWHLTQIADVLPTGSVLSLVCDISANRMLEISIGIKPRP